MDGAAARRRPVVTVGPYLLLALLAVITVIIKDEVALDLGLCGLAAAWMLGMFTLRPSFRDRPAVMGVFLAGLLAIMTWLVLRDPWFGFFTPALYVYAFRLLNWPWRIAGVAAVAILSGTAQAYGMDKATVIGLVGYLAVVLANVAPMCAFAWFAHRDTVQNEQRRQTLERLETSLAENAGLHEQLLVQAREAGVLDERARMAREIHDTLAQGLTGIVAQLQAAEHAATDPAGWRRHVTAATLLARESLTEARRSVHALRPEPLRTARLSEAIASVAEKWTALHGIAVEVTTTGTARPLPPETEVALLRAAQEALANVAKHARAGRVGVTLSYLEHEVAVDVRDDGRGFDPEQWAAGGFGLEAMRQRIEALSGTLRIESEPGAGTGISACIPEASA